MICPYCGSDVIIKDASLVYKGRFSGNKLFVCSKFPKCDSYGSRTLANKELRGLRSRCHALVDPLWREKKISRTEVYKKLSTFLD